MSSYSFCYQKLISTEGTESIILIPPGESVIGILHRNIEFLCFASTGDIILIQWQINTSVYDSLNVPYYGSITFNNETKYGSLSFDVVYQYLNNTFISCNILFSSGNWISSPGSYLIVQGMSSILRVLN